MRLKKNTECESTLCDFVSSHCFWFALICCLFGFYMCMYLLFYFNLYVCVCVYMYMCICVYVCAYMYICTYIYVCVCVYMCIYAYVCAYIYIHIYACMCVCVCERRTLPVRSSTPPTCFLSRRSRTFCGCSIFSSTHSLKTPPKPQRISRVCGSEPSVRSSTPIQSGYVRQNEHF